MSTELELAPPIEVVETTEDDLDIPDMIAHLYQGDRSTLAFPDTTMCGLHTSQDAHDRMHRVERMRLGEWHPGEKQCVCGAPVCEQCYALAMEMTA